MAGLEARVRTRAQVEELENWVQAIALDYELGEMGVGSDAPDPPEWLLESGEAGS
jgi:hypothetical protein